MENKPPPPTRQFKPKKVQRKAKEDQINVEEDKKPARQPRVRNQENRQRSRAAAENQQQQQVSGIFAQGISGTGFKRSSASAASRTTSSRVVLKDSSASNQQLSSTTSRNGSKLSNKGYDNDDDSDCDYQHSDTEVLCVENMHITSQSDNFSLQDYFSGRASSSEESLLFLKFPPEIELDGKLGELVVYEDGSMEVFDASNKAVMTADQGSNCLYAQEFAQFDGQTLTSYGPLHHKLVFIKQLE
ncbi:hypothetical protein MP228_002577 [Amoeboaphelidium protococcarum]|nr:hypothetical protein MP228_002577 [Amoeboaphelidium protococcarum]